MADGKDVAKLVPRAYQEEIFDQARHENVIAALETGSGKTFIAALLIRWIMAQPSQAGKKTFFLVPKVPLVDQQCDFLAEQTPLTVRGYKGAMGLDEWDRARWATEFAQADCLVMTAQVFKNILTHGYWSMDRTSLLVFDECHHARGHHPYNVIMRDHYVPCSEKPKVFGMSASPIWNPKNPKASLETLQSNLSSKVIMVREHVQVLDQHTKKPVECLLRFSNSPQGGYSSYYQPSLWEQLCSSELINDPRLSIRSLQGRYQVTFDALGPAGADYFLLAHASNMLEVHTRRAVVLPVPASSDAYEVYAHGSLLKSQVIDDDNELVTRLDKLDLTLSRFRKRFISDVRSLPSEWLSPKLQAAINVLVEHRSETFHGIIFVQQRQVVMALSWMLSRVAETKDWIRCGELTGHGDYSTDGERVIGMNINAQREVVESFRAGKLNLRRSKQLGAFSEDNFFSFQVIATSVAEEGLDFPACKLVIRFDSVNHMVGYLQSRGRARQQESKYVILVEENSVEEIDRYESFRQAEPYLKTVYQSMAVPDPSFPKSANDEELEDDDPLDLASRESYTIPVTGAMLTYSSAISLLSHLCSSIPRDAYTPPLQPKYTGGFEASVQLPRALPLPSEKLIFHGPRKRTKKEAKRAVAFLAVRELHVLGVFDDHLLPLISRKGVGIEDADGRPIKKVSDVAVMMDVLVASPWKAGPPWYLHLVCIKGHTCAGIVCGTSLPEVDLIAQNTHVKVESRASPLSLTVSPTRLHLMEKFTKTGIWWCITGSPVNSPPACFLVPVSLHGLIDWESMEKAVADERGTYDWSGVTNDDEGKVMLMNSWKSGRPLRLERFRRDLSLTSKPAIGDVPNGDDLENYNSYAEYFTHRYSSYYKPAKCMDIIQPPAGRIIEVSPLPRTPFSSYDFLASGTYECADDEDRDMASNFLLPESYCRRAGLHMDIIRAFQVFGPVCQRICDVFRARMARRFLKFPEIPDDLTLEALTLPCAKAGFNNQRLETMGDSVLKLSVIVYIFNKFPNKHEGQLDALKTNSVSNRLLLSRAEEVHLEQFLTCEPRKMRTWQFILPPTADSDRCEVDSEVVAVVRRSFPRRSLQDCMEASLGAAYVAGGINLALRTGTALGLCFGGPSPWPERYRGSEEVPAAALFVKLQEDLMYTFRNGNLLVEAVKHPSFNEYEGGSCYQRLEFLGDAVIELIVTTYLFNKFPQATSGQMSWARSKAICNSTLAALAVKRLSLHRYLLVNNVELSKDVEQEAAILCASSYEAIAINDWRYEPPKVLADIFESIIGATFVDTGFNYPVVESIVRMVMKDVLELLHPDMPRNPVTRLLEWVAKSGCTKAKFKKIQSNSLVNRKNSVIVMVHDHVVAGPISAANKLLAKGLVAEAAMKALSNEASEFALQKICKCMCVEDEEEPSDLPERNVREKDLNIETTEGFKLAGHVRLAEVKSEDDVEETELLDEEQDDLERQEVEQLLVVVRE